MNKKTQIFSAFAVGVLMFVLSCYSAWQALGQQFLYSDVLHDRNKFVIGSLGAAINEYVEREGAPPEFLEEMGYAQGALRGEVVEEDGHWTVLDYWGHSIVYSRSDTEFTLKSFGNDGLPRGVGIDADIVFENPLPESYTKTLYESERTESPSFYDFIFEYPTGNILFLAGLCGLLGFAVTFSSMKVNCLGRETYSKIIFRILVTMLFAWFIMSILGKLHIPSNH